MEKKTIDPEHLLAFVRNYFNPLDGLVEKTAVNLTYDIVPELALVNITVEFSVPHSLIRYHGLNKQDRETLGQMIVNCDNQEGQVA